MKKRGPTPRILTDEVFGNWIVVGTAPLYVTYLDSKTGSRRRIAWECECRCGSVGHVITTDSLTATLRNNTKGGCGSCKNTTHGMSQSEEYVIWTGMLQRCHNPNNPDYEKYGARGIFVCEHWHTFVNFYSDMGPRPTPDHSVDRTNNWDGYNPQNCVWATDFEQNMNRRSN